ncbi:Transmembrane protein [Quillaja saponaria]|uniref:Transmembrane protein n=1 Tax=Quillaja saponaria TaxID=32244 RepID=A0AAD7QDS5_QUISA|nr:Transmembrane protein [Quillaja saponaria]
MANQGAKKRKEENARHMTRLRQIIIACNVIYVLVRVLIFNSSFTWKHWVGLIVTSLAYVIPYQQLAAMANPTYTDDGELLDGGFDMSTGGVCGMQISEVFVQGWRCLLSYLHDVIYITSFVQVMSIISGKFWYTYLVIPAFGAYKSFGFIKGFLPQVSEDSIEDEKTRKKREKMEKKASRPKFVKARK